MFNLRELNFSVFKKLIYLAANEQIHLTQGFFAIPRSVTLTKKIFLSPIKTVTKNFWPQIFQSSNKNPSRKTIYPLPKKKISQPTSSFSRLFRPCRGGEKPAADSIVYARIDSPTSSRPVAVPLLRKPRVPGALPIFAKEKPPVCPRDMKMYRGRSVWSRVESKMDQPSVWFFFYFFQERCGICQCATVGKDILVAWRNECASPSSRSLTSFKLWDIGLFSERILEPLFSRYSWSHRYCSYTINAKNTEY